MSESEETRRASQIIEVDDSELSNIEAEQIEMIEYLNRPGSFL